MFKLMKLKMVNGESAYVPLLTSDNLKDINDGIKNQVLGGCNPRTLFVFREVGFEVLCGVKFDGEK